MYNKIVLLGNLTRDIEMRYSQGGMAIAKTAIATSKKFKSNTGEQKEEVCFVDITFFGRSAEIANQYTRKGSKVFIEGRLQFEQWTDQNAQKRSKNSVTVDNMQMLDSKSDTNGYTQQQQSRPELHGQILSSSNNTRQPQTFAEAPKIPEIDLDEFEEPPF